MKTMTLVLTLAAALAFPAAANAGDDTPDDEIGDDQFDCEMAEGEWIPQEPESGLTICVYPDGGVLICDDTDCETTPPRVVIQDHRIPTPTTGGVVVAPQSPPPSAPTGQIPAMTGTVMTPATPAAPATTGPVMVPATTGYQVQ